LLQTRLHYEQYSLPTAHAAERHKAPGIEIFPYKKAAAQSFFRFSSSLEVFE